MPTRLRIADGVRDRTLEVSESSVRFVDDGVALHVTRQDDGRFTIEDHTGVTHGTAVRRGNAVWVAIDGTVFEFGVWRAGVRADSTDADALSAPMPATVVRVAVMPGQSVRRGDLLIALEAMKMELAIRAPSDSMVVAVHCAEGQLVQPGRALVELGHETRP
jgi:biotin carboxyl carrier protein